MSAVIDVITIILQALDRVRAGAGGGRVRAGQARLLVGRRRVRGTEAEDSPMAGAAIYGTGLTLRAALEQAGDDARLWRSDIKVGVEAEKEAHGG